MKFQIVAVLGLSVAVAACQSVQLDDTITSKPPTSRHKRLLIAAAKETLYDPYSVRDAELSNQLQFPNGVTAYCGRMNSKNSLGGYTGRRYAMVYFNQGNLTNYISNHYWCKGSQQKLKWHRFSELENL